MVSVAMVTKVQKMLNSNRTADPFETWHKNRLSLKVVLFVFKIFKMAAYIKIKKIVKNSKINRFQWKWIFTGSKTCCITWWPFWFAMVAILNQKWPPKYKNPPIYAKFCFQVDYDVANWYPSFGSHVTILKIISYLVIFCYVLTLFFILTTSTCIVRLGDICNALRYSNQYMYLLLLLLLLLLLFFLSSVKSLSDTFLGDALIKLYETL
jgi:hypothetical protein